MLERRRHITSMAITMVTIAALLVCLVIVALFLEVMFLLKLIWVIGALFILATLGLVVGLGYFLREVHLSSNTVRIRVNK
jgi:protein-S-isoprenylcysteine O-methyltransferase Ste14